MKNRAITIMDLNARHSWLKARVPGAVNLAPDFDTALLPVDRATSLVFYCSNPLCRRAPNAGKRAEKLEYTNVRVMSAGITGWLGAGLPVVSGERVVQVASAGLAFPFPRPCLSAASNA
jgi:rhodanese-related sulfurtransferase